MPCHLRKKKHLEHKQLNVGLKNKFQLRWINSNLYFKVTILKLFCHNYIVLTYYRHLLCVKLIGAAHSED